MRAEASATGLDPEPAAGPQLSLPVVAGLLAGPFLSMVDSSVVNVAVPDIARSLHSDLPTVQWTVSGYLLALAAALAASAWLARRFGSRTVYLVCLGAFTAASALCATSPSVGFLIGARALQGAAGAPLVPLAMGMLLGGGGGTARRVPAAAGLVLFLGPALGPSVGGLLIGLFGWPAIFLVNLPFGAVGLIGALRIDQSLAPPADRSAPPDPLGLGLLAAGLALSLYGAGRGAAGSWLEPGVWPAWAVGGLLTALYVAWALRHPHPAVALRLLLDPGAALSVSLCLLVSVVSFAALFLLPVFMQAVQGLSPLQAGLVLLPQGLVMGAVASLGPRLIGGHLRWAVGLGSLALVSGTAALLLIDAATPGWETALVLCGRGFAFGLVTQPLLVAMMGRLPAAELADGSTLFNVVQRLGGSFGVGLLASLFAARERARVLAALPGALPPASGSGPSGLSALPEPLRGQLQAALAAGFHDVVWVLLALSTLTLGLALAVRDLDRSAGPQAPAAAGRRYHLESQVMAQQGGLGAPAPPPRSEGWVESSGVQLHYLEWGPGNAGREPPLLLLHGLSSNALVWERLARHLRERRLVGLDQRCHGRSQRPLGGYQMRNLAADAAAAIHQLGLGRPLVVGHSWGAAVALELGASHPELVSGAVLVDGPLASLARSMSWEEVAARMQPPLPTYPDLEEACAERAAQLGPAWADDLREFVRAGLVETEDGLRPTLTIEARLEALQALYDQRPEELLPSISGPVLLALASRVGEGAPPQLSEWRRRSLEEALALRPDACARWYDCHHDIPLLRPAELAADLERTALAASALEVARRAAALEGDWSRPAHSEGSGWTARELLAHLASTQTAMVQVARSRSSDKPQPSFRPPFDPDRWNASQVARRRGASVQELLEELTRAATELHPALMEADLEAPAAIGPWPGLPLGQVMARMVDHQSDHLTELARPLGSG